MTRRSAGNQPLSETFETPQIRRTTSGNGVGSGGACSGNRLARMFKGDASDEIGLLLAGLNQMIVTR